MYGAADARLRQVAEALVRHLHAFAREVRLTEDEFDLGIEFLNRIGQASHDLHNEAILFSDAIGFSTLVCLLNNGQNGATETASALLGPFWRMNSPRTDNGASIIRSPTPGPALFAHCRITDPDGRPLAWGRGRRVAGLARGALREPDAGQGEMNLRGKFTTDEDGRLWFRSVKPAGYPVPTDGPVGDLLRAQDRHPFRPAHLHFLGFKPGYKTLITQVFVDDDERLESDVVFGVTRHLIGNFRPGEGAPPAADVTGPWYRLDYDFVMEERSEAAQTPDQVIPVHHDPTRPACTSATAAQRPTAEMLPPATYPVPFRGKCPGRRRGRGDRRRHQPHARPAGATIADPLSTERDTQARRLLADLGDRHGPTRNIVADTSTLTCCVEQIEARYGARIW
jgi:catechol 1,2-dioxygenase